MNPNIYIVQEDDNFWTIAANNGIDFHELCELNKNEGATSFLPVYSKRIPPYSIEVGEKIILPFTIDVNGPTAQNGSQKTHSLPPRNDEEIKEDKVNVGTTTGCVKCKFYEIEVKCGNAKRSYKHKVEVGSYNVNQPFQVVSGGAGHNANDDFDTLTVTFNADNCQKGKPSNVCPVAKFSDGSILKNNSTVCVKSAPPTFANDDIVNFLKKYLVPNANPTRFMLEGDSCDSNGEAKIVIECFPPTKWEGELSLGYFHEPYSNTYKRIKKQGYWGVEGGLLLNVGAKTFTLGTPKAVGKVSRDNELSKKLFSGLQDFLNQTTPFLSDIKNDYASIKVEWPKLKLKGKVENIEESDGAKVGITGNFGIFMDPFIGATFEVDILNILIATAASPAFSKFLIKMKKAAAKGGEGDLSAKANIQIVFTISGSIHGELSWDFKPNKDYTAKGGLDGKIPIKVEGVAEFELDFFVVSVGAGAKIGAKTGFGAELKPEWNSIKGPQLGGALSFDGITFYYMAYARVGAGELKSGIPQGRPETKRGGGELQSEGKYEWVKPAKWPSDEESNKAVSLTDAKI